MTTLNILFKKYKISLSIIFLTTILTVLLIGTASASNAIAFSQQLNSTNYSVSYVSVPTALIDSIAAPDSTMTAESLNESTGTNGRYITQNTIDSMGINTTKNENRTFSVYAKAGTVWIMQLSLGTSAYGSNSTVNNRPYANFNVSDGNCSVAKVVNTTFFNATDEGDGWCRISIGAQASDDGYSAGFNIMFTNNNESAIRFPSYAGVATRNVYLWGLQSEVGDVATTYLATNESDTTPPLAVSNLTNETPTTNSIKWNWDNSTSTDLYRINIYKNGVFLENVSNLTETTTFTGLDANTTYSINITTEDLAGNRNLTHWQNLSATTNFTTPLAVNLIKASDQFNSSDWIKSNVTIPTTLADTIVAPNLSTTADVLNETVGGATFGHYMYQSGSNSVSGQNYTASVYFNSSTVSIIQLTLGTGAFGASPNNRPYVNANITNGNCSIMKSVNATFSDAVSENGWCRVSLSAQASANGYTLTPYIMFVNNNWNAVRYPAYIGNSTASVNIWGAQVETGDVATTYNATPPTTTSVPVANFTQSRVSAGYGAGIQFTDDSTNATSWYWDFGDGNTSTSQSPFYVYNVPGTFTINHSATSDAGTDWENKTDAIVIDSWPDSYMNPYSTMVPQINQGSTPMCSGAAAAHFVMLKRYEALNVTPSEVQVPATRNVAYVIGGSTIYSDAHTDYVPSISSIYHDVYDRSPNIYLYDVGEVLKDGYNLATDQVSPKSGSTEYAYPQTQIYLDSHKYNSFDDYLYQTSANKTEYWLSLMENVSRNHSAIIGFDMYSNTQDAPDETMLPDPVGTPESLGHYVAVSGYNRSLNQVYFIHSWAGFQKIGGISWNFWNVSPKSKFMIPYEMTVDEVLVPMGVTNLTNTTPTNTTVNISWTNPPHTDFNFTIVRLNNNIVSNVSNETPYYNFTGLSPSTTYTISTQTCDFWDCNATMTNITVITETTDEEDTTPPLAVSNLTNETPTTNSIKWNWDNSTSTDLYRINIYKNGVFLENVSNLTETTTFTGLDANTTYSINITTEDLAGNRNLTHWQNLSATTAETPPDTTPPEAVSNLTNETPTSSRIKWNWINPASDLYRINIYKNGVFLQNVSNSTQTLTFVGLSNATTYSINITTEDLVGNRNLTHWQNLSATTNNGVPTHPVEYTISLNATYANPYHETTTAEYATIITAPGDSTETTNPSAGCYVPRGATESQTYLDNCRFAMVFPPPNIPEDATITNVSVKFRTTTTGASLGEWELGITGLTPTSNTTAWYRDYRNYSTSEISTRKARTALSTLNYNYYYFTEAAIENVSKTESNSYMLRSGADIDGSNSTITWASGGASNYYRPYTGDDTDSTNPIMIINYTVEEPSTTPVSAFSGTPLSGTEPVLVTFNDSSQYLPELWRWAYRNATTGWTVFSTDQNPTFTFPNGTYDINLTAINGAGSDDEIKTAYVVVTPVLPVVHPVLFNIKQTSGYLNRTFEPWASDESDIIASANSQLTTNFYSATGFTGDYRYYHGESSLAMAFVITDDTRYANKTVDALLNFDRRSMNTNYGSIANPTNNNYNHEYINIYAFMYDQIAHTAGAGNTTLDDANNTAIRNGLFNTTHTYYEAIINNPGFYPEVDGGLTGYLAIATMGLVLEDYRNISYTYTTADFINFGDEYMFINDPTRSYSNSGIFPLIHNATGRTILGDYRHYYELSLWRWAHFYTNAKGENLIDKYPALKNFATSDTWVAMPNYFHSQFGPDGISIWTLQIFAFDKMDAMNQSYMKWQIFNANRVNNNYTSANPTPGGLLPLAGYITTGAVPLFSDYHIDRYLMYPNWSTTTMAEHGQSLAHTDGIYTTLRTNWSELSDWVSFIIWDSPTTGNERTQRHADQLSFEYYSKGNLLIGDTGEVKGNSSYLNGYMDEAIAHNILMIGNGSEVPYIPSGEWGVYTSPYKAMSKATLSSGDITPAHRTVTPIVAPCVQYIEANVSIKSVKSQGFNATESVVNPQIEYTRGVLNNMEYVVVIDRASSTRAYDYVVTNSLYSLTFLPSTNNTIPSEWGHINGTLRIDGVDKDWFNQPYDVDIYEGNNLNSVDWDTITPYGEDVNFTIYTAPATNITTHTYLTRAAAYIQAGSFFLGDVMNPHVYFIESGNTSMYRVTALLSKYANETARTPSQVTVIGTGNAIKILSPTGGIVDYAYTGLGNNTFDLINTDADTAFIRMNGTTPTDFTLINTTHLYNGTKKVVSSSTRLDYLVSNKTVDGVYAVNVSGSGSTILRFYEMAGTPTYVKRDGIEMDAEDWEMEDGGTTLAISTTLSEHDFEFDGAESSSLVASFTMSNTSGVTPLLVNFTDTSTGSPTSWNWSYTNVTGNMTEIWFSQSQYPNYTFGIGNWSIRLNVTNATDSNISGYNLSFINVSGSITVPVAAFSGTPTSGIFPLEVTFTDTSTGSPTSWNWSFGDGTYSDDQNPVHTYSTGSTYTVILNATNANGYDLETKTGYIEVWNTTTSSFTGDPTSGSVPVSVQFTGVAGNGTTYFWIFGDGNTTNNNILSPEHYYTSAGTYSVNFSVSNGHYTNWTNRSNYITVNQIPPVAAFSGTPTSGIFPLEVTFTDTSTGSPTSWNWSFGDGTYSVTQHPSHIYTSYGKYTVVLNSTNIAGLDSEIKSNYITVYNGTSSSFSGTPTSGIIPLSVQFTGVAVNGSTYKWIFGDGNTTDDDQLSPEHTYVTSGYYTVKFSVSNGEYTNWTNITNYITAIGDSTKSNNSVESKINDAKAIIEIGFRIVIAAAIISLIAGIFVMASKKE